jgi:hypothetical protein
MRIISRVAYAAARQLQSPAVQKALTALAITAIDRFTHQMVCKLQQFENRLRNYDQVVECQWWEEPKEPKQLT